MDYAEITHLTPVRDMATYVRIVSFAIGLRKANRDMQRDFRISMPFTLVPDVCRQFPQYQYTILSFCLQKQTECIVRFSPIFQQY